MYFISSLLCVKHRTKPTDAGSRVRVIYEFVKVWSGVRNQQKMWNSCWLAGAVFGSPRGQHRRKTTLRALSTHRPLWAAQRGQHRGLGMQFCMNRTPVTPVPRAVASLLRPLLPAPSWTCQPSGPMVCRNSVIYADSTFFLILLPRKSIHLLHE